MSSYRGVFTHRYLSYLVRDPANPQLLSIHERGPKISTFITTNREGLLACIMDGARSMYVWLLDLRVAAGNSALSVSTSGALLGCRLTPAMAVPDREIVSIILKQLSDLATQTSDEEKSNVVPQKYSSVTMRNDAMSMNPAIKKDEDNNDKENVSVDVEDEVLVGMIPQFSLEDLLLSFVHNTLYDNVPEPEPGMS